MGEYPFIEWWVKALNNHLNEEQQNDLITRRNRMASADRICEETMIEGQDHKLTAECWCGPTVEHVGMSRAATASMPEWRQVAEDMAMLVQILWARYPAFMPPAELVDFMDSLPDDFLHALMAATGHSHKAAAWDNDHLTCVLIRSLDDSEEQR